MCVELGLCSVIPTREELIGSNLLGCANTNYIAWCWWMGAYGPIELEVRRKIITGKVFLLLMSGFIEGYRLCLRCSAMSLAKNYCGAGLARTSVSNQVWVTSQFGRGPNSINIYRLLLRRRARNMQDCKVMVYYFLISEKLTNVHRYSVTFWFRTAVGYCQMLICYVQIFSKSAASDNFGRCAEPDFSMEAIEIYVHYLS